MTLVQYNTEDPNYLSQGHSFVSITLNLADAFVLRHCRLLDSALFVEQFPFARRKISFNSEQGKQITVVYVFNLFEVLKPSGIIFQIKFQTNEYGGNAQMKNSR